MENKNIYLIVGIAALIVIALFWLASPEPKPATNVDPDSLPGIQTGNHPWMPELDHLRERLSLIGLQALPKEGSALHIHAHLDIFINGKSVSVPADIGVNERAGFISPVHTHEPDSIIHVESPVIRTFTLGQFFDIWGVRFTGQCIGSYCGEGDKNLKVYANGNLFGGDPRKIELAERQEIVVVYGAAKDAPNPIPAAFDFPAGL